MSIFRPVNDRDDDEANLGRPARLRLRSVSMLPTLLTLGNLCCGFGAVYLCALELEMLGAGKSASDVLTRGSLWLEELAPSFLSVAVWLCLFAMLCDALDGRVARKTGASSRFGEQLDALADLVSFGIAPALVMVTLIRREMAESMVLPFDFARFGQLAMLIGLVYACCTALRLARFIVEATSEEASHEGFRGCPSPGAAGGVLSIAFLYDHIEFIGGWERTAGVLLRAYPFIVLAIALLMVSRIPYKHLVSSFLRTRPFGQLVPVLLGLVLLLLYPKQVLSIVAWCFVLIGPVRLIVERVSPKSTDREGEPSRVRSEQSEVRNGTD
jgi:CDP-diacylglycerol--serine O-phosphatidyltransferase